MSRVVGGGARGERTDAGRGVLGRFLCAAGERSGLQAPWSTRLSSGAVRRLGDNGRTDTLGTQGQDGDVRFGFQWRVSLGAGMPRTMGAW